MSLPKLNNELDPTKPYNIILNEEGDYFTFTETFKYLATMFTTNLTDNMPFKNEFRTHQNYLGQWKMF